MVKTIHNESFDSRLCTCKALARRIHHILTNGGSTESYICKYSVTSKYTFATVMKTDIIIAIRFSVSAFKLHHAGINPDLVGVNSLRARVDMSLKLHGESDTTIMKMGRWSSLTFLVYIHNQIGLISKVLTQTMSIPIPFLNIAAIKT